MIFKKHEDKEEGYLLLDSTVIWESKDSSTRVILFELEDEINKKIFKRGKELYILEANANFKIVPEERWESLSFFLTKEAAIREALDLSKEMTAMFLKALFLERGKAVLN